MGNLEWLYQTDMAFRDVAIEAAARAIGTTSLEFAEEWLAFGGTDKPVGALGRYSMVDEDGEVVG